MIKALIIKTSSMGDVIHTLPALTDAAKVMPHISFDWVVEEAFAEIPLWHPQVETIIPIGWRRFRKKPLAMLSQRSLREFLKVLRATQYDVIVDAQGLIKSAVITRLSRGFRCGLDRKSAWEPIASLAYQKKIAINPNQHAITRMRKLFSSALDYHYVESVPDYGICLNKEQKPAVQKYLVFIHGTTWDTKEWPEDYWIELAKIAGEHNYEVLIPWGNNKEQERAYRIGNRFSHVKVLPRCSLTEIASILLSAAGIVSVDTGLGHLAAALSIPTISIYGPTDPKEVGTQGLNQHHIAVDFKCSPCWSQRCGYSQVGDVTPPCFASISPQLVWEQLLKVINYC